MSRAFSRLVAPTDWPITVPEAKGQARIEVDEDDLLLTGLIRAGTDWAEWYTQRAFLTQVWELVMDRFPAQDERSIVLAQPPLQSVDLVTYIDRNGDPQTLDAEAYRVVRPEGERAPKGMIVLRQGESWPGTVNEPACVTVRFTCGYGDASAVPQGIKDGLFLYVAERYENRENAVLTGATLQEVSFGVKTVLWPYRVDKV